MYPEDIGEAGAVEVVAASAANLGAKLASSGALFGIGDNSGSAMLTVFHQYRINLSQIPFPRARNVWQVPCSDVDRRI